MVSEYKKNSSSLLQSTTKGLLMSLLFVSFANNALAEKFVVIAVGANIYSNYRFQADACHAYNLALEGGIKPENIIFLAYDDIADNPKNPIPGKIFNHPDGRDVKKNCVIDYRGEDVTPENYLAVLTGDAGAVKGGTGRVLKSTSEDNVFLIFYDHGAVGSVIFPNERELYRDQLLGALNTMYDKKMYQKLVYYMEACHSGSMFETLRDDIFVYAVTAANPYESSWSYYCDPDDKVNGINIGSCLGDFFSVAWMQNAYSHDTSKETLDVLFKRVQKRVYMSHVSAYGDLSWNQDPVSDFLGTRKNDKSLKSTSWARRARRSTGSPVRQADARLVYLKHQVAKLPGDQEARAELEQEYRTRAVFDELFDRIKARYLRGVQLHPQKTHFGCYRDLVQHLRTRCGGAIPEYAKITKFGVFYNICAYQLEAVDQIKVLVSEGCGTYLQGLRK